MGSLSHEKLIKNVTEKQLLNDSVEMTKQTHTTLVELLHALKIQYLRKSVFYSTEKIVAEI